MRDFFKAVRAAYLAAAAAYHRTRDLQKRRARLPDFFA